MNRFKLYSAFNILLLMILVSHSQATQAERYQMTVLPDKAQGYLVKAEASCNQAGRQPAA